METVSWDKYSAAQIGLKCFTQMLQKTIEKELLMAKNRATSVMKKQVLLCAHFRGQGKEKRNYILPRRLPITRQYCKCHIMTCGSFHKKL